MASPPEPTPEQRTLYDQHYRQRRGGGPDRSLEDLLRQLEPTPAGGPSDEDLAAAWGTTEEFVRLLRGAGKQRQ